MNQQQREQLRRIAHLLDDWLYRFSTGEAKSAATLLRSLAEEPQAEPAAWLFVHNRGGGVKGYTFHTLEEYSTAYRDTCLETIPLYLHPAAKQERLTDEQIDAVFHKSYGPEYARAIESACAEAWGVKL